MRKILFINGIKVLTIEMLASGEMVESDEGEFYPVEEFLEDMVESNLQYEGIGKIKTEWKIEGMFDEIKSDTKLLRKFRKDFLKALNKFGEELIGFYRTKDIIARFEQQGYWSGNVFNIYFYNNGKNQCFYSERRRFGK